MSLTDLDSYYIKSVASLHSEEYILNREPSDLQLNLEEAIKNKTGIIKDLTPLIASVTNRPIEEIKTTVVVIDESKTASSSDNELELDLFNDDLMCIVCNGMDVGARNRLLECSDCHSLYHQECHHPPVTTFDLEGTWACQGCKDAAKRLKKTPDSPPLHDITSPTPSNKSSLKDSPPQSLHSSPTIPSSPIYKPITKSASASVVKPTSSKSPGKSPSAGSSPKALVTPNINIISADRRLQIMKKKAAKLHEKRKLPR